MSDNPTKAKRPIYKKWWFWLLAFIIIIVIASSGGGSGSSGTNSSGSNQTNTAPAEEAIVVTSTKLYSDYKANEISADNTYKGKLVEVSGTVDNIGKDILDKPYISLKTGEIIGSVQCMLDDDAIAEASALAEGTKVTMQGRVNGLLGNVLVKGCTLVTE